MKQLSSKKRNKILSHLSERGNQAFCFADKMKNSNKYNNLLDYYRKFSESQYKQIELIKGEEEKADNKFMIFARSIANTLIPEIKEIYQDIVNNNCYIKAYCKIFFDVINEVKYFY